MVIPSSLSIFNIAVFSKTHTHTNTRPISCSGIAILTKGFSNYLSETLKICNNERVSNVCNASCYYCAWCLVKLGKKCSVYLSVRHNNFFISLTVLSCTCLGSFSNYPVSIIILPFHVERFKFLPNYYMNLIEETLHS